ncbi:MAG: hypothetical protein HUU56_01255 [Bdellovibrionaceae bacterium]|nr:hypothetical protein [Pseudobdellovibrionaceae bacterium]
MKTLKHSLPIIKQIDDFTCGAVCFASACNYLLGLGLTERQAGEMLNTYTEGLTPSLNIVQSAQKLGLDAEEKIYQTLNDLLKLQQKNSVIFIVWFDEDARHYSLLSEINKGHVYLMDPWKARETEPPQWNQIPIDLFNIYWQICDGKIIVLKKI